MALIVIPARYGSSRFPGKPLTLINNIPMVVAVYNQALKCKNSEKIIIATDDKRIYDTAKKFNCNVEMTNKNHKSGTDRVAEVAMKYDFDIVVNLQGDEPFISHELIDVSIAILKKDLSADIATPVKKIENSEEITNPNIVKVVFSGQNYAIYFSRSSIPFHRDIDNNANFFKHIGLYTFRKESLAKFVSLPESNLEKIEKLEQLRAIENSMKIKIFKTNYNSKGIDTPEDLKKLKE